jgi:hypothetical protein
MVIIIIIIIIIIILKDWLFKENLSNNNDRC